MKTDRSTKLLLALIAVGLWGCGSPIAPTPVVVHVVEWVGVPIAAASMHSAAAVWNAHLMRANL